MVFISRRTWSWSLMFDIFLRNLLTDRVSNSFLVLMQVFSWVSSFNRFVFFGRIMEISLSWLIWYLINVVLLTWLRSWSYFWRFHVWICLVSSWTSFENIILKNSYFLWAIREIHFSIAVLDSFAPLSFINASISPVHFSVPMPLIV